MHISTLPGDYGCGSFGKEALAFVDLLSACGFSAWQTLPFCLPDTYGSPYKSASAFSTNPFFIDLPTLCEQGLLFPSELEAAKQHTPYAVEFERLEKERLELLATAARRADNDLIFAVDEYIKNHPRIGEYCKWAADNLPAPVSADDKVFFRCFCEYQFYVQWKKIKEYANSKGIRIIGDIPIYVDISSCDARLHPELFRLDGGGNPLEVAGCPPDAFSEEGQLWGNPIYDWNVMAQTGFSWWRERVSFCFSFFDVLRIDHFRAIEAYWSIPFSADSAKEGEWKPGPGMPFVHALRSAAGNGEIIAEDLGAMTPGLLAFMKDADLPCMRIMQFGEYDGDSGDLHMPFNFPRKSVAYTGTHDNNTILGWAYELAPEKRSAVFRYCGYNGDNIGEGCGAVIRTLFTSPSEIAILPFQDLLLYGKDTRMNTPGVPKGNWTYRATHAAVASVDIPYWRELNRISARLK